jgi:hypothetical protein
METAVTIEESVTDSRAAEIALGPWLGQACTEILRREGNWSFQFAEAGWVNVESPWRIIASGRVALAGEDDGQKFGLPEPLVAAERAKNLLAERKLTALEISPVSGDLRLSFEGMMILEVFNNSSGYEAWHAVAKEGTRRSNVVAQGGGQLAMWNG